MDSFTVYPDSIIYILVPAYAATGGPEALHHLCYFLNKSGYNAKMVYINSIGNPVHKNYEKYSNPIADIRDIKDSKTNILITPESGLYPIELSLFKNIQKGVWYLSVDYALPYSDNSNIIKIHYSNLKSYKSILRDLYHQLSKSDKQYCNLKSDVKKSIYWCRHRAKLSHKYHSNDYLSDNVLNLCQSYYAEDYLKKTLKVKNTALLFEPLGQEYIEYQKNNPIDSNPKNNRNDIVVYYPRKGFQYTKQILDAAPDIKFVPIQDMTSEEIVSLLSTAKVYIDFGPFPGLDRIPRQAACCGCCVITGCFGAAGNNRDLLIDSQYKFPNPDSQIPEIIDMIKDCLNNYYDNVNDFQKERKKVYAEEETFQKHIQNVFRRTASN